MSLIRRYPSKAPTILERTSSISANRPPKYCRVSVIKDVHPANSRSFNNEGFLSNSETNIPNGTYRATFKKTCFKT